MKTYELEVRHLKSIRHDKGMIEVGVEVLVGPRAQREDAEPTSCLLLPVEQARSLLILLRQQLADLDRTQPRSRRSGRA